MWSEATALSDGGWFFVKLLVLLGLVLLWFMFIRSCLAKTRKQAPAMVRNGLVFFALTALVVWWMQFETVYRPASTESATEQTPRSAQATPPDFVPDDDETLAERTERMKREAEEQSTVRLDNLRSLKPK